MSDREIDIGDLEGAGFGPRPFQLTRREIDDFVTATHDRPERWAESAPPGLIAAALFVIAPELLDRLAGSVIHGEQTFSWSRPVEVGPILQVSGTVTRVRERGGVNFVSFDMTLTDGNEDVATGTSLFLVSGAGTAIKLEERVEPAVDDRGSWGPGQVGMSRSDLVRYAAATGDWNPIHWDHESALAAGLPGVVVHGLAQASWALSRASEADGAAIRSAKIRFRNPLLPAVPVDAATTRQNDTVTVSITDGTVEYLSANVVLAG